MIIVGEGGVVVVAPLPAGLGMTIVGQGERCRVAAVEATHLALLGVEVGTGVVGGGGGRDHHPGHAAERGAGEETGATLPPDHLPETAIESLRDPVVVIMMVGEVARLLVTKG